MAHPDLAKHIDSSLRIICLDGKQIVGKLLAFDKHMNLVVDEAIEFRHSKAGESVQRTLGLVLLRGETVMSTIVEDEQKGDIGERLRPDPASMQL